MKLTTSLRGADSGTQFIIKSQLGFVLENI